MINSLTFRRIGLMLGFLLAGGGSVWALESVNPNLLPIGREVLDYIEQQHTLGKHISGNNIYPRAANSYMSMGRRGVIWMENMEWMTTNKTDVYIADFKKYRMLICFGWHWALGDKWDAWGAPINRTSPDPFPQKLEVSRVLDPAMPEYAMMIADLDQAAAILQRFQDAGVPVLWRGLHEHGGGWFWYDDNSTPENSAELFRFVYNYFTHTKGLNNLIWYYNAGQGLGDNWDYRKRFYPGNSYVDFVDVNMYDSDHVTDAEGQWWYYNMMTYISDGAKLIGGGDQPMPQTPDYMDSGRFPPWLIGTPWEGAPFTSGYTVRWANYFYGHPRVITLADAPAFGSSLGRPDLYPDLYPEVGLISPESQTWVYESDPVFVATARDRDGSIARVEFFAENVLSGGVTKIGEKTTTPYRYVWTNMPNGTFKITVKATDNSGNVSDSANMGGCWTEWNNWVWVTKGYVNAAIDRPATASSAYLNRIAAQATDGNYETGWESNFETDLNPHDAWLAVDLGAVYPVEQVNLRWGWKSYAKDFVIEVSNNGSTWSNVYSRTGFAGETAWASVAFCRLSAPVNARYVRFRGTKMDGVNSTYFGYKLSEIEVPIPLNAAPAAPMILDLHNRNHASWAPKLQRTVFGTPCSVIPSGAYTGYREDYFDAVGDQLCGRVIFGLGEGRFALQPYDEMPRDLTSFTNGHLHVWMRADAATAVDLQIRDASGVHTLSSLVLTSEWQRVVIPLSEHIETVDFSSIGQPFVCSTTSDTGSTIYLRDLFWSTEPWSPITNNVVLDGSFETTTNAFATTRQMSNDPEPGWWAGVFSTWLPRWQRTPGTGRAEVTSGTCPGLGQILLDQRKTTGLCEFSFRFTNRDQAGTSNRLRVGVYGIRNHIYSVELAFENAQYGIVPIGPLGPVGDVLAEMTLSGDDIENGFIRTNMDLSSGYDNIAILFWADSVDVAAGDHMAVDEVSIIPLSERTAAIEVRGKGGVIDDGNATPSPSAGTDFGELKIGEKSDPVSFQIVNTGNETLEITGMTLSGDNPHDFEWVTLPSNSVSPGGQTSFSVRFSPRELGARCAVVKIANDLARENPRTFQVGGFGIPVLGSNLIVNPSFENAMLIAGSWCSSALNANGWVISSSAYWARDESASWAHVPNVAGAKILTQIIEDGSNTTGNVFLSFRARHQGTGNKLDLYIYGANEPFNLNLYATDGPQHPSTYKKIGTLLFQKSYAATQYNWTIFDDAVDLGTGYRYLALLFSAFGVGTNEIMAVDDVRLARLLEGYEVWSTLYDWPNTGVDDAPNADPNGDGIPNLLAYACALPPLEPNSQKIFSEVAVPQTLGAFRFLFRRATGGAEGISYAFDSSTDLANWTPVDFDQPGNLFLPLNDDPDGDGSAEHVEVVISTISLSHGFVRLRIVAD